MKVLNVRNVAEALPAGLAYLAEHGRWEDSRAGRVIVAPGPVTTVYERPRERVLFSALRDANPFFHLAEAMWMLAGRRDATFLNNFVRDFGERFAEPNGTINDAYGYRWRHALGFDQLDAVVRMLSEKPESRQAVIQMWDTYSYSRYGEDDLCGDWKTRPCNTHVYLRIRDEEVPPRVLGHAGDPLPVLDLTVLCRSNDIVWGAYGANAVHFSVLQEYLAARLDVGVGTYYQVSNNYHCYEPIWNKLVSKTNEPITVTAWDQRYPTLSLPQPLVHDVESFDHEVTHLLNAYEILGEGPPDVTIHSSVRALDNLFLCGTVWPMLMAHRAWRNKGSREHVRSWLASVEADDWRVAGQEWIERRMK